MGPGAGCPGRGRGITVVFAAVVLDEVFDDEGEFVKVRGVGALVHGHLAKQGELTPPRKLARERSWDASRWQVRTEVRLNSEKHHSLSAWNKAQHKASPARQAPPSAR